MKKLHFRERLEKLDKINTRPKRNLDFKKIREVEDIDLAFDFPNENTLNEFRNVMMKFMSGYNIGQYVSKNHWGQRGYKQIQQQLLSSVKKMFEREKPVTQFGLFDDLRKDVDGKKTKDYTSYDYSRVARTEGKRMSIVYQLLKYKEAGLTHVRYQTRGDKKVRDSHQILNGKVYEIDYLLSQQGEKERIPIDPNCRCRYIPQVQR